nr:hypothetical protein [Gammaproteobacteria bacterium]
MSQRQHQTVDNVVSILRQVTRDERLAQERGLLVNRRRRDRVTQAIIAIQVLTILVLLGLLAATLGWGWGGCYDASRTNVASVSSSGN